MDETTTAPAGQLSVASVDLNLIERLYTRFASVYDALFGPLLHAGRREAIRDLR